MGISKIVGIKTEHDFECLELDSKSSKLHHHSIKIVILRGQESISRKRTTRVVELYP